jgi:hypothetical protein
MSINLGVDAKEARETVRDIFITHNEKNIKAWGYNGCHWSELGIAQGSHDLRGS